MDLKKIKKLKGALHRKVSEKGGGEREVEPGKMTVEESKGERREMDRRDRTIMKRKGLRGIFYRKAIEAREEKEPLPGFAIKKAKRMIEFPSVEDVTKINIIYPLIEPFIYVNVKWEPETKELVYNVIEPKLSESEKKFLERVSDALVELVEVGLGAIKEKGKAIEYLEKQVAMILKEFGVRLTPNQYMRIMYYIYRNFVGFNEIEAFLQDPNIEDISCDGVDTWLYVIHRKVGSVRTNVKISKLEDLREFIIKLAERCGRYVSYAEPILDGTLPDGSRVSATLAGDVATRGPTFTIRKFSEKPFSPIEQVDLGTASTEMLAYYWYLIEHGASMLIVGGVATGKTSFLNTLCMFIPPECKIVSIEDSVMPNTEMIAEIDGEVKRIRVGELIDSILRKNKLMGMGAEIGRADNIKILSMNKNGKMGWKTPSSFIRHKVKKKVLDIKLATGRTISVTKDHSLFALNENGEITPIPGERIKEGSFICTPRYLPINCPNVKINLLNYPEIFSDCFVTGKEVGRIVEANEGALREKMSASWLNALKRNNKIRLSLIPENAEVGRARIYSKYPSHSVPIEIKIDKELATLAGIWLADGSYDKNSTIFSVEDDESREVVKRVAKKIGLNVKKHSDGVSLMINSDVFKRYWKKVLKLAGDAYTKRVPTWAFGLPSSKVAAMLRGYFSGDGWVRKNEVVVASASLGLLRDMQTLLLRFGIILRISNKKRKDGAYEARISGIKFLRQFRDKIGLAQIYKQEALEKACRGSKEFTFTDVVPLPKSIYRKMKQELKSKIKDYKKWKSWGCAYLYGKRNIERGNLKKIAEMIEDKWLKEKLNRLSNNDVFWDKVVEVNKGEYEGYVYDLSVEENENFIANNVVAHNTRELRIPNEHWIPSLARTGFGIPMPTGEKYGGVTLFDLLKESFRQNPDYVIVGETRGAEAYVMFQGMSSGHPSMSTFHAGSIDTVIKRLTSPPIELSPMLIESLNVITIMVHAREKGKSARRIREVVEVESVDPKTEEVNTNVVFRWDPATDGFERVNESIILRRVVETKGGTLEEALEDIEMRRRVLEWLHARGIKDYLKVTEMINMFYKEPAKLLEMMGERALARPVRVRPSVVTKALVPRPKVAKPPKPAIAVKPRVRPKPKPKRRVSILDLLGFKFIEEK